MVVQYWRLKSVYYAAANLSKNVNIQKAKCNVLSEISEVL